MSEKLERSSKRRTKSTVFLTPLHKVLINKSGKTTQKFFENLLHLYEAHDMQLWKEGHLYHGHTRIVATRADFLNEIIHALPDPYSAAKKLGESTRTTYLSVRDLDTTKPANRARAFKRVTEIVGFGVVSELSPGRIVVESPAIHNEPFMRGYYEGFMSATLRTLQATTDRIVFQAEKCSRSASQP